MRVDEEVTMNPEVCAVCQERSVIAVPIGETAVALCRACGPEVAGTIYDKLSIAGRSMLSPAELTAQMVESFATYPIDALLNELVTCTVRYNVGPLEADNRRIATALLERMAVLGFARKRHRDGCEIWPRYGLCDCPWEVPS
jgi:hypothetical protein